ncbi:hypothetical protein A0J61_11550 [Choanephora cucurbitarum]|uniref:Uncharacterized protein n=1 Tax=Choanephora cucurbitarum TaxID=101091 RepID=A0A1C7MU69_9FUNG|nr:hypothetical protein A0J61_11550 [Choanephora cucurbitarum]
MNQDSLLYIDIKASDDEISICSTGVDIKPFDNEQVKVETSCLLEIQDEVITIDTSDSEVDVEDMSENQSEVELVSSKSIEYESNVEDSSSDEEEYEGKISKESFLHCTDKDLQVCALMKEEMEKPFSVGTEFSDIDELQIRAQKSRKKYNRPITTDKSSQKE